MSKKKGKTSSKRKTSLVEKYLKTCKKKLKKMGTTGIIKAFAPYVIFGYFGINSIPFMLSAIISFKSS